VVYDIEFIRRLDGTPETLALGVVRIVGHGIGSVIDRAEELFRSSDTVPRPSGFRIRENGGEIVHEFDRPKDA